MAPSRHLMTGSSLTTSAYRIKNVSADSNPGLQRMDDPSLRLINSSVKASGLDPSTLIRRGDTRIEQVGERQKIITTQCPWTPSLHSLWRSLWQNKPICTCGLRMRFYLKQSR